MTKVCKQCGREFHRRYATANADWERRKFCTRQCWADYRSVQAGGNDSKECANCGGTFRRKNSRQTEEMWQRKLYCSRACYAAHHVGERHHLWKGGRSDRSHRQERYGISGEQFQEMRERQNGICAICETRDANCVDHDHDTGKVRALLCRQCNAAIGLLSDDGWLVARAAAYLLEWSKTEELHR